MRRRDGELVKDAPTALIRMLDAIIDRLADELENVSSDIEQISGHIFHKEMDERRIPAARLTALLTRIGRSPDAPHQGPLFGGQYPEGC